MNENFLSISSKFLCRNLFILTTTVVGVVSFSTTAKAQHFSRSCFDIILKRGVVLEANCKTPKGYIYKPAINLDAYIKNENGRLEYVYTQPIPNPFALIARTGGFFSRSCRNTELFMIQGTNFVGLRSQCANRRGQFGWTFINLDRYFTNRLGSIIGIDE
jgi:hypothetical protein